MAKTIFIEPYVVTTTLNRAFNDQSPSYTVYNNQVAMATSIGFNAFALSFGAAYAGMTEDQLSTRLLGNLGLLPNAGLQTGLRDYLESVGKGNVGIVAMQLGEILSGLEQATGDMAVYKAAAVAWNAELDASYLYSANPANTVTSPAGPPGDFGLTLSLTAGDDALSSAQTSNWGDTILAPVSGMLSSADAIDGGLGIDTLKATLAAGAVVAPTLKSVEKVFITAGSGAEFSAAGASGLADLRVDAAAGPATFSGVGLATTVGIQNSDAGGALTVKFVGAGGPADSANLVFSDAAGDDEIIVAGVETLVVQSAPGTVAATTVNHARITAAQAEKIVIGGGQALTTTVTGDKLSVIDASAIFMAKLDLALAGTQGVSIALNAQAAHKVTLGAGADTLSIAGLAGMAAQNMDLSTAATLAASAIEVAGFVSGTDAIQLSSANPAAKAAPGTSELASIAASSSLLAAATLAATTVGANKAIAFRYGADTYILVNDGAAALGENDSLVKLTGVTALVDASWTSV